PRLESLGYCRMSLRDMPKSWMRPCQGLSGAEPLDPAKRCLTLASSRGASYYSHGRAPVLGQKSGLPKWRESSRLRELRSLLRPRTGALRITIYVCHGGKKEPLSPG